MTAVAEGAFAKEGRLDARQWARQLVLAARRPFAGDAALLGLEVEAPNGDQRRSNPIATHGNSAAPTRATALCRRDQLKKGVVVISGRVESDSAEKWIRRYWA